MPRKQKLRAPGDSSKATAAAFEPGSIELTRAIQATCRAEFERLAGKPFPWSDKQARKMMVKTPRDKREREAREAVADLRPALVAAERIARKGARVLDLENPPTGQAFDFLARRAKVLRDLVADESRLDDLPLEGRARVVILHRRLFPGFWRARSGEDRKSHAARRIRGLTVASLLHGERPFLPPRPTRVEDVIQAEAKAIRQVVKRLPYT